MFPEALLHYVWKFRMFDHIELFTDEGESIDIIHPGFHNKYSGPDFSEAKIRIGDKLWAGHVEMHLKSSDWLRHRHDNDGAYENVILHAVWENDTDIRRQDGTIIPALVLKDRISSEIIRKSMLLYNNPETIPCSGNFSQVPELIVQIWLERLSIERLEMKSNQILDRLERNNNNWEQTFYEFLARNFGLYNNTDAFGQLARITPINLLNKHKNNLFQIESLLFGQAGMLESNFEDSYAIKLKEEYSFLKQKYSIKPMLSSAWKFGRMRPAAFPSIRIALFAKMIFQTSHLFSKLLETDDLNEFIRNFDLSVDNYWFEHYRFDDSSNTRKQKKLGENSIKNLVINTLVPFLFVYGNKIQRQEYYDRALIWLGQVEAEKNNIVSIWQKLGFKADNANQTQALIQLKKNYCDKKRCLECPIGNKIMS